MTIRLLIQINATDGRRGGPDERLIVPTLCVGMPQWTLCVRCWDAERPGLHSHAERGNEHGRDYLQTLAMASASNASRVASMPATFARPELTMYTL